MTITRAGEDGPPTLRLDGIDVPDGHTVEIIEGVAMVDPPLKQVASAPQWRWRQLDYYENGLMGKVKAVRIRDGGVVDELVRLCALFSALYDWLGPQSVAFILTGEMPVVPTTEYQVFQRYPFPALTRINMQIDPATSPDKVAQEYREIRNMLAGGRYRSVGRKSEALAAWFVSRLRDKTWAEHMKDWNSRAPKEWRYDVWRRFYGDCHRAYRNLLTPIYSTSDQSKFTAN